MNLIFIGAPGSGKGTQAEILKSKFNYNHISTGDLLRAEVAKGTELGDRIKGLIDGGKLVDDSTVLELFQSNLNVANQKYIFDGFPRNVAQCEMLSRNVLDGVTYKVIYFQIDEARVVDRIINRRIAPQSGKIYNLITDPPKNEGVCDVSGEPLVHREDDREDVVKNRIAVYNDSIKEMLSYYEKLGLLFKLDASMKPENVSTELINLI